MRVTEECSQPGRMECLQQRTRSFLLFRRKQRRCSRGERNKLLALRLDVLLANLVGGEKTDGGNDGSADGDDSWILPGHPVHAVEVQSGRSSQKRSMRIATRLPEHLTVCSLNPPTARSATQPPSLLYHPSLEHMNKAVLQHPDVNATL